MENQDILDSGLNSGKDLSLNASAKDYLSQTAKWAKFLAIMSFIFALLIIIIGLAFGSIMSYFMALSPAAAMAGAEGSVYPKSASIMMAVFYGLIGLVMLYPAIRLYQFSSQTKTALETNNTEAIENGLKRLRSVFRFYGILTIISIAFYALAILGMVVGMSALN